MDVREILITDPAGLLEEELEMLEEELATGGYDASYRKQCSTLIEQERHARRVAHEKAKAAAEGSAANPVGAPVPKAVPQPALSVPTATKPNAAHLPHDVSPSVLVSPQNLSPYNEVELTKKTPRETIAADLSAIRRSDKRKSLFRDYLKNQPLIDEPFLDANLSLFDDWELSAILDHIRLSEPFLEKYLSSLAADRVAITQLFSEEFFMRHFGVLKPQLVLQKGKNPWRRKEDRSKKLDTFLRLKGVHF